MEAKYMNSRFGLLSLCGAINRRMTEQYIEPFRLQSSLIVEPDSDH